MKPSLWDILSTILLAASLAMGVWFFRVFNDPYSSINPFPPPTQIERPFIPSITPSLITLPEVWTEVPEINEKETLSTISEDEARAVEITNTPVLVVTEEPQQSATPSSKRKPSGILLPTKNPFEPTDDPLDDNKILKITAPIGVFNNVWQNIQSIPSFSWSTTRSVQEIDHFLLYFGSKQNGKLATKTGKMNQMFKAVPSGIYYFRVLAVSQNGTMIGSPSSFLFKYDDTPPSKPTSFMTTSTGDTDYPYFTWGESKDAHSGMIGGMAGYAIYQGPTARCMKPVAITTANHWTPVAPIAAGATEYFCVRAMDAIGNESDWVGPVAYTYEK
ncbi:hypothetical protein LTAR_01549 [Leptolinea tardivitalis]|nr:hypothetical protein LTAR_01549 [Leptolinea tardivitalis]